uniref:Uncharacterized protein n=1 Tax=Plectus sambesii TaxID=2011161 RepID=A0A914UQ38_9BILA
MTVHLSLLCLLSLAPLSVIAEKITHDYCIVGAGPAGLQLGFFLNRDGHDYVIFEKSDVAGSFFAKYPRHRQLISINKRFTGRYNKEFNLRHDWNSLMSDDDDLLFGKYSEEYFPDADDYLKYLADYQRKLGINVKFNTEVSNISQSQQKGCKFEMQDQHENNYCCKRVLVIANGISDPIVSHGVGHDLIEGYESMSVNPKEFDGQSVLIFGRGNSALETAKSLYGHAAYLNLASRSRLRFSWDTHYVGDIRGINNEVLDSYHLKSLDGILEGMSIEEVDIVRRTDGKLDLIPNKKSHISLEDMDHNPVRHGYDRILRCIGFQWDKSLFNANTTPALSKTSSGKYPLMGTDYQSLQFPGMYFAGALAHSLDWRKSAGGFIHGFRYT